MDRRTFLALLPALGTVRSIVPDANAMNAMMEKVVLTIDAELRKQCEHDCLMLRFGPYSLVCRACGQELAILTRHFFINKRHPCLLVSGKTYNVYGSSSLASFTFHRLPVSEES